MTLYRLLNTKDAKFSSVSTFFIAIFFLLPCPFLLIFVPDIILALKVSLVALIIATILGIVALIPFRYYRRCAALEGDALKICTPKGRVLKTYRLCEMNKMYAFVGQGRYGFVSKSLLLYPENMFFQEGWMTENGECLPYVTLWIETNARKIVVIQNKELEEKILAYYGEPITEPDSTV